MTTPRPPEDELIKAGLPQLARYLQMLNAQSLQETQAIKQALNPSTVGATSESTQTFTVKGLKTDDHVEVTKPTDTAGLTIVQAWVSAADTLSLKFYNSTGAGIDPVSETYKIVTTRT